MRLSSVLSNALSGLALNSHAAKVVSTNIANATNDNYGRRELEVSATSYSFSGGVRVAGIVRHADPILLSDRRNLSAEFAAQEYAADAMTRIDDSLGSPEEPESLSALFREFESALAFAESNPQSTTRLKQIVASSQKLASKFGDVQKELTDIRTRADRDINNAVSHLNESLQTVEGLNTKISKAIINGHDPSGLVDQRQQAIDTISEYIPVTEFQRSNGAVSLVTKSGTLLLERKAQEISFQSNSIVMPHMTNGNGLLGTVEIGGYQYDPSSSNSGLSGGKLQALFEVRDVHSMNVQNRLDGLAFELADAFQGASVDPTLTPTDPGLFTDAGSLASIGTSVGLAGRMAVNVAVDEAQGGDVWRIRDGLNATAEGPAAQTDLLTAMQTALTSPRTTSHPEVASITSLMDAASDVISFSASTKLEFQTNQATSKSQLETASELFLETGVSTDEELQRLLVIETNYAANARMIETVEAMLDSIMRIGR